MSASVATSPISRVLRFSRDRAGWATTADIFAVLTAFALPWSTSLVAIFVLCWLATAAWVLDFKVYLQSLRQPICALPVALFALALLGTLWSDASWGARLYALSPAVKLLVLPGLFYHFERSARGMWVFIAFLASCTLLMAMSWIVAVYPELSLQPAVLGQNRHGIFVKNYIDQGQEFALCAVALAYPIVAFLRTGKILPALLLGAIALSFVANMAFVIVSRTALVTMPILLMVFVLLHLRWRGVIVVVCAMIALAGAVWTASPHLRATTASFLTDYQQYKETNRATSIGMRLEFWRKSLGFFAEAPIIGHGTGSTRGLFEQAASGPQTLVDAQVVGNPHNQTLNMAIQWGVVGVVMLYAMWLFHLMLFRGDGMVASIGLLVVLQNIFSSMFNSHLFDFHEGWMYVLGVGVAGGMTLKARLSEAAGPAMTAGMRKRDELSASSENCANPGLVGQ